MLHAPVDDATRTAMIEAVVAGMSLGARGLLFAEDSPAYADAVKVADALVPQVGGRDVAVVWSLSMQTTGELRNIAQRLAGDGLFEREAEVLTAAFTVEATEAKLAQEVNAKRDTADLASRLFAALPEAAKDVYREEVDRLPAERVR